MTIRASTHVSQSLSEMIEFGWALVVIILCSIGCVLIAQLLPLDGLPAYALFPYFSSELVAISLVGAFIPLIVSAVLIVVGLGSRSFPRPFRNKTYWLILGAVAIVSTLAFGISHELNQGIALPGRWAIVGTNIGSGMGVVYYWLRGKHMRLIYGFAECYVMGFLGMLLGDLIRTFSLQATTPGAAVVWGGSGFHDLVFWFGLYIAVSFVAYSFVMKFIPRYRKQNE